MRIIVAYDGSAYTDAAIDDLALSGFPHGSEILIASVADFSAGGPNVSEFDLVSAASRRLETVMAQVQSHQEQVVRETESMLSAIADRLRQGHPEWEIHSEVLIGDPAEVLLRKVDEWGADLIMGGSRGRSAIGRFFLGSVSKTAAENSPSSVRVVRGAPKGREGGPPRIILGAKDTGAAGVLVDAAAKREWPAGTEIRLVAIDTGDANAHNSIIEPDDAPAYQLALDPLAAGNVVTSLVFETGDPVGILMNAAESFRADAIFVVSGYPKGEKGLDAMASALVTTAHCTVEIVR